MSIRKIVALLFFLGGSIFLLVMGLARSTATVMAQECSPEVQLSKQIKGDDLRIFPTGSDVTFDITIQNIGNVELTSVNVQDALVPDCARSFTNLPVGGTINYTCTSYGVTQGFRNVAKVISDSECGPVHDEDISTVELAGLAISKQELGNDSRIFASGSDVTYTISVTNTDEVELTNIVVSDPLVPDCEAVIDSLPAFSSTSFTCIAPAVTTGFTNIVTATTTIDGETVLQAQDPSTVLIPGIDISKEAEGDDSRTFPSGSDVTFTIVVTNTGDVDLTNIVVTDPLVPDCDNIIQSLLIGQSTSYTCTATGVTEGFTNTASVSASGGEFIVEDQDPSTVNIPGIDISKQAEGDDTRTFPSGSDVTFTIVVTNTGDVDLTNVSVVDPLVPDCDREIGDLAAGASTTYECTATNVTEGFTNIAKVSGFGGEVLVTDEDPSTVEISDKLYWLYLPFGSNPGFIKYNVSFGYEDLRIEESNDFDYNDWVLSVETNFDYTTIDQDTINVNRITFDLTPQARGALLAHEYHISFPPNTFGSNGSATLNVFDSGGNVISTTLTTFISSQTNDFHVFDRTSDALPPTGSLVNTIEGIGPNQAAQTAELVVQFNNTFPFTINDFGPHGEGLFFEPYLQVIPPTGAQYSIGNGDIRTIVFPISNWRWPEEHIRIDRAYPGITFVGPPQIFTFPDGWWQTYNNCVYGDGVVCSNP